jgi:1-acyl-sn-glycerol-3-phosphate acyltransferase
MALTGRAVTHSEAGLSTWRPPAWPAVLRWPLRGPGVGDRWLVRGVGALAARQTLSITGLEHILPDRDPFILAPNHSMRREAVLFPSLLVLHRGGRRIHFLSDWNNSLWPHIGLVMHRAGVVNVIQKPARPRFLNVFKPLFWHPKSAHERLIDHLRAGRSVGVFPEGTVNRDPRRLLTGRPGAAWLSLRTGVPVVPVGIRYPDVPAGEPIPELSSMEIHIGAPLRPGRISDAPTLREVRAWHAAIMGEIARLSGKEWQGRARPAMRRSQRNITAMRVASEAVRNEAVSVLKVTYEREKSWVADAWDQFPAADLVNQGISWFVARADEKPAGVLRLLYDPPIALYAQYGFKLLDDSINVEEFVKHNRVAEVGRFAVLPEHRRDLFVVAALMRAATAEAIERGCTHLVTDVFEDDPHSPYGFHTRVIGFRPVATHDVGELNERSRRITLLLDVRAAYKRHRDARTWFYRYMTEGWDESLHRIAAA